jgi:hypothetical protein
VASFALAAVLPVSLLAELPAADSGNQQAQNEPADKPSADAKTELPKKADAAAKDATVPKDRDAVPQKSVGVKKSLDDELLKKLLGDTPAAEKTDDDPLERAIQSMRSVQQKIADRQTGTTTRALQTEIVKDLEKLIEIAKQPPPPQPQPNQQPQDQQQKKEGEQQPQPQQQTQGDQQKQQTDRNTKGEQPKKDDEPAESQERTDKAQLTEAELARRQMLVKEIWGHLPPNVREKLLNISSEKPLPKYEDLVRRYYEALAEPSRKPRDR